MTNSDLPGIFGTAPQSPEDTLRDVRASLYGHMSAYNLSLPADDRASWSDWVQLFGTFDRLYGTSYAAMPRGKVQSAGRDGNLPALLALAQHLFRQGV